MGEDSRRPADLMDLTGGYGRWQRDIYLMFFFASFPASWQGLGVTFFAADMDHWCARPPSLNVSLEEWKNRSLPSQTVDGLSRHSSCYQYTDRYRNQTQKCRKWDYDTSDFTSTIVSQWDLVCDKEWLVSLSQSIYMAGVMVAVLLFGQLSDRFGRRPIMLFCIALTFVAGLLSAFSISFPMYAASRFLVAMGASGLFTTAFVTLVEIVGPEYRSFFGIAIEFGWCTGYVLLPCLAWLIRNSFYLQLALTIPVVFLGTFWWWVPESPRWLLSQGKLKECQAIMKKAALKNGQEVTDLEAQVEAFYKAAEKEQEANTAVKRYTILDLMKFSNMRKKTFNLYFNWCVNAFVYYALSLNTSDLGGNIFVNFFISGAVEFPAYIISIVVIKCVGRKIPLIGTMVIGGLACILTIPVDHLLWVKITLAMIGKFCITSSFGIIYIFSAEIFPTVVRNIGIGSSSTFARIGSILAPFVKDLGRATYDSVPLIIYGAISIAAGLLVILLPETNNKPVPDTIEEAENISRKSSSTANGPATTNM